jgi:hypothetical protein
MYLNYEILLHGYKTIYLGEMPIENLKDLKNILVLSCIVRQCNERDVVDSYVQKMSEELLDDTELWYIGRMVEFVKKEKLSQGITILIPSTN